MQSFDFNLAINDVRRVEVLADYVYYLEGSAGGADSTIGLKTETGSDTVLLKPGQAFRLPRGQSSARWIITNNAKQAAIVGRLFLGEGDFSDNRISGSVEVIDGGKNRTLANSAFAGGAYCPALASNYPQVQLWNPSGSGVNAIITGFGGGSSGAIASIASAIKTSGGSLASLAQLGLSKLAGGAAAKCQLRYGNSLTLAVPNLTSIQAQANVAQLYKFSEPIVLPPDTGLLLVANGVGADLNAFFEFSEAAQ